MTCGRGSSPPRPRQRMPRPRRARPRHDGSAGRARVWCSAACCLRWCLLSCVRLASGFPGRLGVPAGICSAIRLSHFACLSACLVAQQARQVGTSLHEQMQPCVAGQTSWGIWQRGWALIKLGKALLHGPLLLEGCLSKQVLHTEHTEKFRSSAMQQTLTLTAWTPCRAPAVEQAAAAALRRAGRPRSPPR